MTDIDLSTVPLSALTAEIKRRMNEFESAKRELGFGTPAPAITKRAHYVTGKTKASRDTSGQQASQANRRYWEAKKAGDTERANKHLAKLKRLGKEPWKA
jgi:hypothetical protein